MPLPVPINIPEWKQSGFNAHLLKPPVNNYCCFRGGATVMIVGGPNQRTDYHINQNPEYFYMYKGDMLLKVVDEGKFRDIPIHEGEMYLLPGNTPHCPVRFADTVGIVVEQDKPETAVDRIRWYCDNCKQIIYEEAFHMSDLGTQVEAAVEKFRNNAELRKCKSCGCVAVAK